MPIRKQDESKASIRRVGGKKQSIKVVVVRQQMLNEEEKCTAAIRLLLTEIVRQHLKLQKEFENV